MAGDCSPGPSCDEGEKGSQLGNYKAFSRMSWEGEARNKGGAWHSCSGDAFSLRNSLGSFLSTVRSSPEALTKGPFTVKSLWT